MTGPELVVERVVWIGATRTHLRELDAEDAICHPKRGDWELFRAAQWNRSTDGSAFEEPDYPLCENCAARARNAALALEARLVIRPRTGAFPPAGYRYDVADEGLDSLAWKIIEEPDVVRRRCRMTEGRRHTRCPNIAVAELNRGRDFRGRRIPQWWAYCGDHLYARWIEGGRVVHWRLVEATP